jgi:uncharacterized protein
MLSAALLHREVHAQTQTQTQTQSQSQAQDAALSIMQRSNEASRTQDSSATATFTLKHRDGSTRVRRTRGLTRLQDNGLDLMRLVRFESPADIKGTSTLLIERTGADDEMWIYLPALGKVRRLSVGNKRDAFFGTDFSYGDIMGHPPTRWRHTLLRQEPVDGVPCHVIESTPSDDETRLNTGYTRRMSWVDQRSHVALRVEMWDLAGNPLKRIVARDVRPVGKGTRHQAMLLVADNLQTGHQTTLQFEDFKADTGVDARQFTPQRLEP